MTRHFPALMFLAAALMLTSPAMAEVRAGAFTVFPFVGGYTFDGVQHLQTNVATGVGLGYTITPNWGVEGRFTWVPLQATQGDIPGEYSLFNFHADVLYHFMPEGRLVPYVALGGGLSRTEWLPYNNDDAILVYGGGVKYFLNDWLALRGDLRQIFSFHEGADYWDNFEYTVGLSFQFGGAKPGVPAAKAELQEAPAPPPQARTTAPAPGAAPLPKPAQPPAPATGEQTTWQAKEGATKVPAGKIALTGMTVRPDALELTLTKSFYYEIHVFSKPRRLEINIHGAANGLDVDTLTLNRIGIATVRLEDRAEFLNFVLYPAAGYQLPSRIDVTNNFRGLLIHMAPPLEIK